MSCFNKYKWELLPEDTPAVKRNCPKCKAKTLFVNTKKFRVNANKNNIDVWLIYQCEKCRSTWNMSILERVNPKEIDSEDYEKFASNDNKLAEEYGFNRSIHAKNKSEIVLDNDKYKIKKEVIEEDQSNNESIINITSSFPLDLRIDKLLSDNLGLSRSKVKSMFEEGRIFSRQSILSSRTKVIDGLSIHIRL